MAEVKFEKGSMEWNCFVEFWQLCQKYWVPEESDEWWDKFTHAMDDFCRKYQGIFSRRIALAFICTVEERYKALTATEPINTVKSSTEE